MPPPLPLPLPNTLLASSQTAAACCLQALKVGEHLRKHKVTGTGYTNEDNPFGDTNLTERFVWGKKLQKEIAGGRDVREMTAKAEMARQAERLVRAAAGLPLCWAGMEGQGGGGAGAFGGQL